MQQGGLMRAARRAPISSSAFPSTALRGDLSCGFPCCASPSAVLSGTAGGVLLPEAAVLAGFLDLILAAPAAAPEVLVLRSQMVVAERAPGAARVALRDFAGRSGGAQRHQRVALLEDAFHSGCAAAVPAVGAAIASTSAEGDDGELRWRAEALSPLAAAAAWLSEHLGAAPSASAAPSAPLLLVLLVATEERQRRTELLLQAMRLGAGAATLQLFDARLQMEQRVSNLPRSPLRVQVCTCSVGVYYGEIAPRLLRLLQGFEGGQATAASGPGVPLRHIQGQGGAGLLQAARSGDADDDSPLMRMRLQRLGLSLAALQQRFEEGEAAAFAGSLSPSLPALLPGQALGRVVAVLGRRAQPLVATVLAPLPSPSPWSQAGTPAKGEADMLNLCAALRGLGGGSAAAAHRLIPLAPSDGDELLQEPGPDQPQGRAGDQQAQQRALLAVPMDARFPKVRVRTRGAARLAGMRVLVAVDVWLASSAYPEGHVLSVIGPALEPDTEVRCVMLASGVADHARPFPPAAVACLPALPALGRWSVAVDRAQASSAASASATSSSPSAPVSPSLSASAASASLHAAQRRDLRLTHAVCSVDPPGCTDIDDALSLRVVREAGTGAGPARIEVGVHIADVSHFVRAGSALDTEARARGTTVYLVDRRLDMLPQRLSEDVCSLRARVDRYAMSVLWTLEEVPLAQGPGAPPQPHPATPLVREADYAVVDAWAGRTIIRSGHALTYDQAKRLIGGKAADEGEGEGGRLGSGDESEGEGESEDAYDAALRRAGLALETLDPAACSAEARALRARERRLYPRDPAAGGLCGAPVHPSDEAGLALRLRGLSAVAHWLTRRRGRADGGLLELDSSELRFSLARRQGGAAAAAVATASASGPPGETGNDASPALALALPLDRVGDGEGDGDGEGAGYAAAASEAAEPTAVMSKRQEDINSMVAELMIFANEAAAKLAFAAFPRAALLRRHAAADKRRFEALLAAAASAGIALDMSSKGALARSLEAATACLAAEEAAAAAASASSAPSVAAAEAEGGRSVRASLLRALTLQAMTRAEYVASSTGEGGSEDGDGVEGQGQGDDAAPPPSPLALAVTRTPGGGFVRGLMAVRNRWHDESAGGAAGAKGEAERAALDFAHFGLGLALYTHFTSPIRRYADLAVHREMAAALGIESAARVHLARGRLAPSAASAADSPAPPALAVAARAAPRPPPAPPLGDAARGDRPLAQTLAAGLGVGPGAGRAASVFAGADAAVALGWGPQAGAALALDAGAGAGEGEEDDLLASLLAEEGPAENEGPASPAPLPPPAQPPAHVQTLAFAAGPAAHSGFWRALPGQSASDSTALTHLSPLPSSSPSSSSSSAPRARESEAEAEDALVPWPARAEPLAHAPLAQLCAHLNERNQAAKVAGWECDELFLALFLRRRVEVASAVVAAVRASPRPGGAPDVELFLPRFGISCHVRLALGTPPVRAPAGGAPGALGAGQAGAGAPGDEDEDGEGASAPALALPPALLGLRVDAAAVSAPGAPPVRVSRGVAAVLALLPPAQRLALVTEGALAAHVADASAAVEVDAAGAALVVRGPSAPPPGFSRAPAPLAQRMRAGKGEARGAGAGTGAGAGAGMGGAAVPVFTLRVLDPVRVALTCPFDARSVRRPPILVELLADTPAARAFAGTGTAGAAAAAAPATAAVPDIAAPAAARAAPAPLRAPASASEQAAARAHAADAGFWAAVEAPVPAPAPTPAVASTPAPAPLALLSSADAAVAPLLAAAAAALLRGAHRATPRPRRRPAPPARRARACAPAACAVVIVGAGRARFHGFEAPRAAPDEAWRGAQRVRAAFGADDWLSGGADDEEKADEAAADAARAARPVYTGFALGPSAQFRSSAGPERRPAGFERARSLLGLLEAQLGEGGADDNPESGAVLASVSAYGNKTGAGSSATALAAAVSHGGGRGVEGAVSARQAALLSDKRRSRVERGRAAKGPS